MSLANFVSSDVPNGSEPTGPMHSAIQPADLTIDPRYIGEPVGELPGLDSFGSEEGEDGWVAPARARSGSPKDTESQRNVAVPNVVRSIDRVLDHDALQQDPSPPSEPAVIPRRAPLLGGSTRLMASGASFARRAVAVLRDALLPSLRWSRVHLPARMVLASVLVIGGIGEAGWIGARAARGVRQFLLEGGASAAPTPSAQSDPAIAASGSPVIVSVYSNPPAVPPPTPNVPGWVSVSTPVPIEILERGRVIGASWNGGVRLPPGRHDLRLVNRTSPIDVEQPLDIAAGGTTSVVVEFLPGSVEINAVPSASVRVDGKAIGRTPVVDLQLSGGPHEVLFSHPRLGERRMTINVMAGKPLKLSTDLRR